MLAALVLRLVDVPVEAIEEDYVRSEARLRLAESAPRDVINRVIAETEARHGSIAAYLLQAGAPAGTLLDIRARLV